MKKIVKNYFYNVIYQILSLLTPLITAPYIARTLGDKMIGVSNFANSIVSWFIIFGILGIRIYGNKEIAKCGNDVEKRSKIFWEVFLLQFCSLLIVMVGFYIYFLAFPVKYQIIFLVYGITILSTALDISWLYVGLEDFKKITIRDFIVKFLNIVCILIFIKKPEDLFLFASLSTGFFLFSQLIMWFNVKKYIHFTKITFKGVIKHLKPNLILFVPQLACGAYALIDQIMIGLIAPNIAEVAYYVYAQKFVHMFLFVTTSIGTVMLPHVASMNAREGKGKVTQLIRKTFAIALFLAIPMAFGLAAISPFAIPWLLTDAFTKTGYLIVALSPILIAISLSNVLGTQYLIPLDRTKEYTISVIAGCIINLILNLILIPIIGAFGAAIASVIAEIMVFIIQFHFVKKEGLFIDLRKKILRYLISATVMVTVMIGIGLLMGIGISTALIQFVSGSIIYLLMIFIFKDSILIDVINYIKSFVVNLKTKNK